MDTAGHQIRRGSATFESTPQHAPRGRLRGYAFLLLEPEAANDGREGDDAMRDVVKFGRVSVDVREVTSVGKVEREPDGLPHLELFWIGHLPEGQVGFAGADVQVMLWKMSKTCKNVNKKK